MTDAFDCEALLRRRGRNNANGDSLDLHYKGREVQNGNLAAHLPYHFPSKHCTVFARPYAYVRSWHFQCLLVTWPRFSKGTNTNRHLNT